MQIETLEVPRDLAKQKYKVYKEALKRSHDAQTETLKRAFHAVSSGKKVIDINRVAEKSGLDAAGLPKIAICRLGRKYVFYRRYEGRPPEFRAGVDSDNPEWGGPRYWLTTVSSVVDWPVRHANQANRYKDIVALVPSVPPELRPEGRIDRYHILFEPEWKQTAPSDPLLLRRIGASLYVVLAHWDLTEIERAVLAEAFQ